MFSIVAISAENRDTSEPLSSTELQIYLQRANTALAALGVTDVRISQGEPRLATTETPTTPVVAITIAPVPLPLALVHPRSIVAVEGETVHFTSLVLPSNVSLSSLTWSRQDGQLLPTSSRVGMYGVSSLLELVAVGPEDAGIYQSTATGALGQSIRLDVALRVEALSAYMLVLLPRLWWT